MRDADAPRADPEELRAWKQRATPPAAAAAAEKNEEEEEEEEDGEDGTETENLPEIRSWARSAGAAAAPLADDGDDDRGGAGRRTLLRARPPTPAVPGSCADRWAAAQLRTMPRCSRWAAARGPAVQFVEFCLRGVGQVFFCNNPASGLLFCIAVLAASWKVGALMLLGVAAATLCAWVCGFDRGLLASGIWGYNGALVGCALAVFCAGPTTDALDLCHTDLSALWTVLGTLFCSVLSVFLTSVFAGCLVPTLGLTPLTFPFQVAAWIWILAAQQWPAAGLAGAPVPGLSVLAGGDSTAAAAAAAAAINASSSHHHTHTIAATYPNSVAPYFRGVAQTFLVSTWYSGLLMLIGIFLCSPISAGWAAVGASFGTVLSSMAAANASAIEAGLHGYNACLCAMALGGFFVVQSGWPVFALVAFGMCLSTLLGPTTSALLTPVGLPALTFPFTAATWILVLVAQHQLPSVVTVAVEALSTPEDHRLRLRLSRAVTTHFRVLAQFAQSKAASPEDVARIEATLLPIALCAVAAAGDVQELTRFLRLGAPADGADYDGRTALHTASAEARVECVRVLLNHIFQDQDQGGLLVNAVDAFGGTPLEDAIRAKSPRPGDQDATVALLVAHGAKLNLPSSKLLRLGPRLCAVAAAGDARSLSLCLSAGAPPSHADYDGRTAAHLAAAGAHTAVDLMMLQQLLLHGGAAIATARDRFGHSPIDDAVRANFVAGADLLRSMLPGGTPDGVADDAGLEGTQSPKTTQVTDTSAGLSADTMTIAVTAPAEAKATEGHGDGDTVDAHAVPHPHSGLDAETMFLESALGSIRDHKTATRTRYLLPSLLCSAAAAGDLDSLSKAGARAAAIADYDFRTPLMIAVDRQRVQVVKQLLADSADAARDVHRRDRWGVSPLWIAIRAADEPMVRLLKTAAASSAALPSTLSSSSAAAAAATQAATKAAAAAASDDAMGGLEVATYLCELAMRKESAGVNEALRVAIEVGGLDVNACDYDKRTALHVAAEEKHWKTCTALLDLGAQTTVVDRWGNTPPVPEGQ